MSIELLSAFQFLERKDFIHRLDPRTKIIMVLIYLVLLIIFKEIVIQLIIMFTLIPLILAGHMTRTIIKSLRGMTFLFFFIIFFNTLFVNLNLGVQMSLRLINILISFSLLFQTTSPDDLSQALTKMGIPYRISFALSLAFRFVPTLAQETETITEAQKSRGLEIQKGGMFQQLRNLFPLLVPLISNSIQRAYYIAESLEARSFGVNIKKRTNLFPIKLKTADFLILFWCIILLILGIYLFLNLSAFPFWLQFRLPI